MINILKEINLRHSSIAFRSDGIVFVKFGDHELITFEDSVEILQACESYLGDKKAPFLYQIGKYMNVTKEAREFSASPEGLKCSLAEAFILDSIAHRIIADFYLNINKPVVPTKFFKTIPEGEIWLKTFL